MTKPEKEPLNPQIPTLAKIERLSRNFVVNDRKTLRPVEKVLRKEPQTLREVDHAGGFGPLLTRDQDQVLERDYLSRFSKPSKKFVCR